MLTTWYDLFKVLLQTACSRAFHINGERALGIFDIRSTSHAFAVALCVLLMSLMSARMFGRFHGGNTPDYNV